MKNDTALAQLRDILPFPEFARRYPHVYSSDDPMIALDLHQPAYVDLQPPAWPVSHPQRALSTALLGRSGLVAALLEGETAIIGTPRTIFRHLRDEATVRFWLGPTAGKAGECLDVSAHLVHVGRRLQSVVA